jgi:hypothetical protein
MTHARPIVIDRRLLALLLGNILLIAACIVIKVGS